MIKLTEIIQRPRMQLRWKLLGGFLAADVLLIVALVLALLTIGNTDHTLQTIAVSNNREDVVNKINLYQERLISIALDSVVSGKSSRAMEYDIASSTLANTLRAFEPQPWQQENYNDLKKELAVLQDMLSALVKSEPSSSSAQLALQTWNQNSIRQINRIRVIIQDLLQKEKHNATVVYESSVQQANTTNLWISILSLLALFVAIGLALLMTEALIQPVMLLRKSLANLANGDLTTKIEVVNRDELGELGTTFNHTLLSLSDLVRTLYAQSQKVSNATSELKAQANNQVSGSIQQATAITEATQAIEALKQTAIEITQQAINATEAITTCLSQANTVSRLAEEMSGAHDRGRATVARTIQGLHNLKERIASIDEQQRVLLEQSGIIQDVIKLLDNIAQSTHLLALNASIEAAGAGQYGERFAVVAREVKGLADKSVEATRNVRDTLNNMAGSVREVSQLSTECLREAEAAVTDSRDSDELLLELASLSSRVKTAARAIFDGVQTTAELAANIEASTTMQKQASSQMVEKMLAIDVVTTQNLASIKQGESATQELNFSARQLAESADAFKLETAGWAA